MKSLYSIILVLIICAKGYGSYLTGTLATPRSILFECTTTTESLRLNADDKNDSLPKFTVLRAIVKSDKEIEVSVGKKRNIVIPKNFWRSFTRPDVEAFTIKLANKDLFLELTGKPLKRQGFVRVSTLGKKSFFESRVTCH
jgi:hypothetical protein